MCPRAPRRAPRSGTASWSAREARGSSAGGPTWRQPAWESIRLGKETVAKAAAPAGQQVEQAEQVEPVEQRPGVGRRQHRHFLHYGASNGGEGSGLPPRLLSEARVLCAVGEGEVGKAMKAAREEAGEGDPSDSSGGGEGGEGGEGGDGGGGDGGGGDGSREGGGEGGTWDWNLVDWSAEDPFAEARAAVEDRSPAGDPCEARTLAAIRLLLSECLGELPRLPDSGSIAGAGERESERESEGKAGQMDDGGATAAAAEEAAARGRRADAARGYVQGQRALLLEAGAEIERREGQLQKRVAQQRRPVETTLADGRLTKRQRSLGD